MLLAAALAASADAAVLAASADAAASVRAAAGSVSSPAVLVLGTSVVVKSRTCGTAGTGSFVAVACGTRLAPLSPGFSEPASADCLSAATAAAGSSLTVPDFPALDDSPNMVELDTNAAAGGSANAGLFSTLTCSLPFSCSLASATVA